MVELGYSDIEERIADQYVVKNVVEVNYRNLSLDRLVSIEYTPNTLDNKPENFIGVSLFKDIKLLKQELDFRLYVKKYHPDFEFTHLSYFMKNNKTSFEENLNISLAGFSYILQEMGENLLKGSEWENGLIVDWSSASSVLYKEQKRILGENNDDNS